MRIKFNIFSRPIDEVLKLADDNVEIIRTESEAYLAAETTMIHANYCLPVIESDSETFIIRINKKAFSGLTSEKFMELIVDGATILCNYYDNKGKFMYSRPFAKQSGFINITEKIQILSSLSQYTNIMTKAISSQVSLFSKLNLNVCCLNNVIFACDDSGYFARKLKIPIPNFAASSFYLSKLCSTCASIFFIKKWIYGSTFNDVNIFLNQYRLPKTSEIDFILRKGYTHYAKISFINFNILQKKLSLSEDKYKCVLNVYKEEIKIKDRDSRDIVVFLPVIEKGVVSSGSVTLSEKFIKSNTEEEIESALLSLQEDLKNGASSTAEILRDNKDSLDFPIIEIPSWLLNKVSLPSELKVYLGPDIICFKLGSGLGNIYFTRIDAEG